VRQPEHKLTEHRISIGKHAQNLPETRHLKWEATRAGNPAQTAQDPESLSVDFSIDRLTFSDPFSTN
jgi:hypothetical protein